MIIKKEDVSGRVVSCCGGQSISRPRAIRMAPKACNTFQRIAIRRSVSGASSDGFSCISLFIRLTISLVAESRHGQGVSI